MLEKAVDADGTTALKRALARSVMSAFPLYLTPLELRDECAMKVYELHPGTVLVVAAGSFVQAVSLTEARSVLIRSASLSNTTMLRGWPELMMLHLADVRIINRQLCSDVKAAYKYFLSDRLQYVSRLNSWMQPDVLCHIINKRLLPALSDTSSYEGIRTFYALSVEDEPHRDAMVSALTAVASNAHHTFRRCACDEYKTDHGVLTEELSKKFSDELMVGMTTRCAWRWKRKRVRFHSP